MSRDRSLDEFANNPAEESGDGDEDADSGIQAEPAESDTNSEGDTTVDGDATAGLDETNSQTHPDADSDVEPASSTYRWDPDGVECAACGQVVDRLWSQDDEHVCADCKDW